MKLDVTQAIARLDEALRARRTRAPGGPCPVCAWHRDHQEMRDDQVCGLCRDDARYDRDPGAYYLPHERICCRAGCGRDATRYDPGPEVLVPHCDEHGRPDWPALEDA